MTLLTLLFETLMTKLIPHTMQCTSSSLWQFVLEGRYLFFMWYFLGGFSTFGGNKIWVRPFFRVRHG